MKKGWQTKTIGDVCEVIAGQSPEGKFYNAEGKGMPFYQGKKDFGDKFIEAPTTWTTQTTKIAKEGDILMSVRAPVGPVNFATDEVCIGRGLAAIRSSDELNRDFLFYQLWHLQPEIAGREGAVFASINKAEIEALPLAFAPLAEQQRIVGLLDEAFEGLATAKANAEKNLQNARALFESHLQSVFTQRGPGWVEKAIGELCERLHQGLNTAGEKVKFYESGYPIIQTRNIDDGVVELDSKMKFMSEEDWQLYKDKYRPEIGDVFFTNIGTIGKTAIVTTDRDYLIHWNIFKLRPLLGKITSEFLRYTLEQLTLSGYFEKLQKGGTVDFVTKKMISEALILLPPIAEQKTIVAKLDDLREETKRLARLYERKHAALEALKKSLLHQAFTGAL
jgi:type I restriction enzyme S subunit